MRAADGSWLRVNGYHSVTFGDIRAWLLTATDTLSRSSPRERCLHGD
jgi:hypothetical protein